MKTPNTQLDFSFMFVEFKGYNDKPLFIRPLDIKFIKPNTTGSFSIYLSSKDYVTVYNSVEELKQLLQYSYFNLISLNKRETSNEPSKSTKSTSTSSSTRRRKSEN